MRNWDLWNDVRTIVRFPRTEQRSYGKFKPPLYPDRSNSPVTVYPGVLFTQWGPL